MEMRELFNSPGMTALAFLVLLVPFWIANWWMDRRTLRREVGLVTEAEVVEGCVVRQNEKTRMMPASYSGAIVRYG